MLDSYQINCIFCITDIEQGHKRAEFGITFIKRFIIAYETRWSVWIIVLSIGMFVLAQAPNVKVLIENCIKIRENKDFL